MIFIYSIVSRPVLGPTQPSIQWAPEDLFLGVWRPGHQADHPSPFIAEVKVNGYIPPLFHTSSWHDAESIKRRNNVTFTSTVYSD
jgi:hypothetical protein